MIRYVPLAIAVASVFALPRVSYAQSGVITLDSVVVVGERVVPEAIARPLTVLDGADLSRRQSIKLGETLSGLPGVAATGFGSNASRPIIRGQDGERIKLLQNSAPLNDASSASFDHAVSVSPYALEQIEILRGPAALLYSGSAVGGVVNLVDRRILRNRVDAPSRSLDLSLDSADRNRQAAFEIEAPLGQDVFFHIDGLVRKNDDTRTPKFTDGGEMPVTGRRVLNTAADAGAIGMGFSRISGAGYWGVSIESERSDYGVPKEVATTIGLNRHRLAFAADQKPAAGPIERVRVRAGLTDYEHDELESGAVSSVWKNRANDIRVELSHKPLNDWKGLFGFQWEYSDFDVTANEEHPLLPRTRSPKLGLFLLEETGVGTGTLRLGARIERARVKARNTFGVIELGDAASNVEGEVSSDGPGQVKSFTPVSVSAEYNQALSGTTQVGVSVSHVQRAPANFELFAMGIHHASGLFEAGNPSLDMERGHHLDVTFTHTAGNARLRGSAFFSRYVNYITLIKRGDTAFIHQHEPGEYEPIPVYDYLGVGAKFYGLELEYASRHTLDGWQVSPSVRYDFVIGRRVSNNAYIPRLTPHRLTPAVDLGRGPWMVRGEVNLVGRARLGENDDFQAAGYSQVNVSLEYKRANQVWSIRGSNLTNRLAYNAGAVDEIRGFTPLAGRALQAGVRWYF